MIEPYYADDSVTLYHGDALDVLRSLDADSLDAVCTDPPYGLEFMGKEWDAPWQMGTGLGGNTAGLGEVVMADGAKRLARPNYYGSPNPTCRNCGGLKRGSDSKQSQKPCRCGAPVFDDVIGPRMRAYQRWCQAWAVECLRVLKPGGHLLAFGGTRTVHRLTSAIEDAGFEIRDGIDWLYAAGFPKSLAVDKAIDRAAGAEREVVGPNRFAHLNGKANADVYGAASRPGETTAATDAAARWSGWGTALKPAREPIVVARKPLQGTVAANVLRYGTGALNIDACRVSMSDADREAARVPMGAGTSAVPGGTSGRRVGVTFEPATAGRWPSNVVLSHAGTCGAECAPGCPVAELDAQSGITSSSSHVRHNTNQGHEGWSGGTLRSGPLASPHGDSGGASRFFPVFRFEAKAPTAERPRVKMAGESGRVAGPPARSGRRCNICGNQTVPAGGKPWPACGHDDWTAFETEQRAGEVVAHPTVKPLALMRWLVRLVTPPGGTVLDPFAGSGTTGEACVVEGFRAVLVEREADYLPLIVSRLSKPLQPVLNLEEMS